MTQLYTLMALAEVKAGMVLSDDLLDHQGQVLLTHGATLSESMIEALRRHQVETVPVVTGEASEADTVIEATQHAERLAILYRKLPEDEQSAASTLRWYVRDFRLGTPV